MTMKKELVEVYRAAAKVAQEKGISASDEDALLRWIRQSCRYPKEVEFFVVLGIGSELADLEAQSQGYKNEVDRAFQAAQGARA
jgi:hypothetical protein